MFKKKFITCCLYSILSPVLVSICYGHTIVENKCPSKVIYTFDSENFESGRIQKFETKHHLLNVIHFETPTYYPVHELKIAPKNQPERMIISKFEGIVFEVVELELDQRGFGKEFLVVDKPSARGYRYSLLPNSSLDTDSVSLASEFNELSEKIIQRYWSLPESYYPMFTDINDDGKCEIINFNENFQQEFIYPRWYGIPEVYSFNAVSGRAKLNQKLTGNFVDTSWNDQKYKFVQIRDRIKRSKNTLEFFNKMPEFDLGISATRYLYTAKRVNEFDSALNDLRLLIKEYKRLKVVDNFGNPPLFFHLISGQKFANFAEMSEKAKMFTDEELDKIQPIYSMITDTDLTH